MAIVATQVADGDAITFSAASAGGDKVTPSDDSILLIKNGAGAEITATITTPNTVGGLAIADKAVTVAAGATAAVRLDRDLYRDDADGLASLAWSSATSVTFAVVKV